MAKNKALHHPAEHPQEILRTALKQAKAILSPAYILRRVKPVGSEEVIGKRGLRNFIAGITRELDDDHYEQLANAWLRSRLGRAIRFPDTSQFSRVDDLIEIVSTGKLRCPKDIDLVGRYFMYYGSYVDEKRYGVRALEVTAKDDDFLSVTDTIRDLLRDDGRVRVSHGMLTFFDKCPQILLLPSEFNETKRGFTLMAGDAPFVGARGKVERITGTFLTMTVKGTIAIRNWMMLAEPDLTIEAMIEESGAFTPAELRAPARRRHRDAFDQLKTSFSEPAPDPMATWKTPQSTHRGQSDGSRQAKT